MSALIQFATHEQPIAVDVFRYEALGCGLSLKYYRCSVKSLSAEQYLEGDNPLGWALAVRMKRGRLSRVALVIRSPSRGLPCRPHPGGRRANCRGAHCPPDRLGRRSVPLGGADPVRAAREPGPARPGPKGDREQHADADAGPGPLRGPADARPGREGHAEPESYLASQGVRWPGGEMSKEMRDYYTKTAEHVPEAVLKSGRAGIKMMGRVGQLRSPRCRSMLCQAILEGERARLN